MVIRPAGECSGATFGPDGRTLYADTRSAWSGTYAIEGPGSTPDDRPRGDGDGARPE